MAKKSKKSKKQEQEIIDDVVVSKEEQGTYSGKQFFKTNQSKKTSDSSKNDKDEITIVNVDKEENLQSIETLVDYSNDDENQQLNSFSSKEYLPKTSQTWANVIFWSGFTIIVSILLGIFITFMIVESWDWIWTIVIGFALGFSLIAFPLAYRFSAKNVSKTWKVAIYSEVCFVLVWLLIYVLLVIGL